MRLKNLHYLHELTFFIFTIYLLTTYGSECADKLLVEQIPGWFIMTFSPSILGKFPGVTFCWYFLGVFELFITGIYLISFFKLELLLDKRKPFLKLGVLLSLFHMVLLNLGQRIVDDYAGAAGIVNYMVFMVIVLILIDRAEGFRYSKTQNNGKPSPHIL